MEKQCCRCKLSLSVGSFKPRKRSKDGLNYYCNGCEKIRQKEWCDKNKDKVAAKFKKWFDKNKRSSKALIDPNRDHKTCSYSIIVKIIVIPTTTL